MTPVRSNSRTGFINRESLFVVRLDNMFKHEAGVSASVANDRKPQRTRRIARRQDIRPQLKNCVRGTSVTCYGSRTTVDEPARSPIRHRTHEPTRIKVMVEAGQTGRSCDNRMLHQADQSDPVTLDRHSPKNQAHSHQDGDAQSAQRQC